MDNKKIVNKLETLETISLISSKFKNIKKMCSEFYKIIESASTQEESEKLINIYKQIIQLLKEIKEESYKVDNVEIDPICFKSEEDFYKQRQQNCDIIQAMVQHIRGCKESFEKYNQKILA